MIAYAIYINLLILNSVMIYLLFLKLSKKIYTIIVMKILFLTKQLVKIYNHFLKIYIKKKIKSQKIKNLLIIIDLYLK